MEQSVILTNKQIEHKTKRIAYQIFECNSKESEIIIAGIKGNGYIFAQHLEAELKQISDLKITLCEVNIDKRNPLKPISTDLKPDDYKNKPLVLVDDVLNSGSTLIYGIKHFLEVPIKQFNTAVMIDRNHKKYPVKADFKGLSLSTSLREHVNLVYNKQNSYAVLE
ncbi:phosphoribosyltransferase family protein [Lutibacter sp. TH_r2]|uniref:phosphoribosyltransferase family protein n=1 Tax=Lutibacter sp. TH_r2 TaxID=3082083 RepID=UPI0029542C8C|nr:phosphoribosyltransferase family protein [Lutibacter sp. TH_r2]MDV7188333.1 phosphoribosyltransferase family protein [Lutibacter sp. TH_r2]